jgi:hypothetical protein
MASLAGILPTPVNIAFKDEEQDEELEISYNLVLFVSKQPPA